ncbi:uncharacterized protein [Rutidosis leptorrhynchoides]|uniref:uncharacterized protein n=1 Tax=Rutidosis leptorrhynchoides TaxID=125765 RepID=UPI003A99EB29
MANWFNDFIDKTSLMEIPLGGRNFTRVSDDGIKFSKLDRFLVNKKFYSLWNDLTTLALDRENSDHCPIVIKDEKRNFMPKPFKVFDVWFDEKDVDKIIEEAWGKTVPTIARKDCVFRNKLKNVKDALPEWSKSKYNNIEGEIELLKNTSLQLELKAESTMLDKDERNHRKESRKLWLEKENVKREMLKQKARVKWILEGDENTRYFHSIIKRNNNKCNIRGLNINGIWNDSPHDIKKYGFRALQKKF